MTVHCFRLLLGQLHLQKCPCSSHQYYGKSGNYYNFKINVVFDRHYNRSIKSGCQMAQQKGLSHVQKLTEESPLSSMP